MTSAPTCAAASWPTVLPACAAAPLIALWVRNLTCHIGEERITIHRGILTKIQQNIPYRAITDFMVHRSLFDRFLGIGSIRVQTAGQSASPTGYEGQLAGLLEWQALHEQLQARLKLGDASVASGIPELESADVRDATIQVQIMEELRAIRRALEGR